MDHNQYKKLFSRTEILITNLIWITIKLLQHVTYRSYNMTKYENRLFTILITNFSKLWHDRAIKRHGSVSRQVYQMYSVVYQMLRDRTIYIRESAICERP